MNFLEVLKQASNLDRMFRPKDRRPLSDRGLSINPRRGLFRSKCSRRQGEREMARRRRQIERGILKVTT